MDRVQLDTRFDSTSPKFLPWWIRAYRRTFEYQLARNKRALAFCRGRASDLKPILQAHIEFLESKQHVSIQRQRQVLSDTSTLLERLAIGFNASFDIPTLRTLKSGLTLLNTHANANKPHSTVRT